MRNNLGVLLNCIDNYSLGIEMERLVKEVLRECKLNRKDLSVEMIKEKGFDIYERKKTPISKVFQYALDNHYIEPVKELSSYGDIQFRISLEGKEYLNSFLTDNYCNDYMIFKKNIEEELIKAKKPLIKEIVIMNAYWNGRNVNEFVERYKEWGKYERLNRDYHMYVLSNWGYSEQDLKDKYIFNFTPRLFVPYSAINSEVSLEIKGVDMPSNMNIMKPYPNKRYFVAGVVFQDAKAVNGFYPIIEGKETFPKTKEIQLIWDIKGGMKVIHNLNISFEITDGEGYLLSSKQHFLRNIAKDEFDVTTNVEERESYNLNRHPKYILKGNVLRIFEDIKLVNFPFEVHHASGADSYFETFRNNIQENSKA